MPKLKIKLSHIVIFLLILYLLSVFSFAGLQSIGGGGNPETNIIYNELSHEQVSALISNGATIMKFKYSSSCPGCEDQKYFIEEMAKEYKNQLLVIELKNNTYNVSEVFIVSIYGNRTFTNPTEEDVFTGLCDLMINPPINCVLKPES